MKDAQGAQVLGSTRWKRFGLVMVPTVAAAAGLTVLMANGAVAASFAVSGSSFEVSADSLHGTGFAQYGDTVTSKDGTVHPIAVSGIASAQIHNLCQSVSINTHIPGVDTVVLRITAGQSAPVTATNLLIDADTLQGNATFNNIVIGQDASTLSDGGPGAQGQAGMFGQQAQSVELTNLRQTAWSTTAGTFALNGLNLSIGKNDKACF